MDVEHALPWEEGRVVKPFGLGIWSHNIKDFGGKDDIPRHADRLARMGTNILVPCVKNPPGLADFFTDVADVNPDYPAWDPLRVLIDACHERGIQVHPWFCVFKELIPQSRFRREHPEFAAKVGFSMATWSPQSRYVDDPTFMCACRPEVQDYEFELCRSIALGYRPDGLHMDYIRTGGPCRCEFCKGHMQEQGLDVDSLHYDYPVGDPAFEAWTEWRVSKITGFVQRLHDFAAHEGIDVSAAVEAKYPDCLYTQAQDWVAWAEVGAIGYLFPMSYTNSLRFVLKRAISHLSLVGDRARLWEGIGVPTAKKTLIEGEERTESLIEQIRGVLAEGVQGVTLFEYRLLSDEDVKAIRDLREE